MDVRDKLCIDGAWVAPGSSDTVEVIDSATEEVIGTVRRATGADVDAGHGREFGRFGLEGFLETKSLQL